MADIKVLGTAHRKLQEAGLPIVGVRLDNKTGKVSPDWGTTVPTAMQITQAETILNLMDYILEEKRADFYVKFPPADVLDAILDYIDTGIQSNRLSTIIQARREVR